MAAHPHRRHAAAVLAVALAITPAQPAFQVLAQSASPASTAKPQSPPAKPQTTTAKPQNASPQTAKPATAKPAGTATASTQVLEPGWPRAYQTPGGGRIVVYQPQVATWEGQKKLVAYAATSFVAKPAAKDSKPGLGTITLEADTRVSLEERLVKFDNMRITNAHFSTLPKEQVRDVVNEITEAIPDDERIMALDRVLAAVDKSKIIPKDVPGLKADPPTIFFSQTPAILVSFDSDPVWSPIEKNDLRYAVNTNWDVFEDPAGKTFYLRNERTWLKTTDLKGGVWVPAGKLPAAFSAIPANENFKDVKANVPGVAVAAGQQPKVFVSTTAAELILLKGAAVYVPVAKTKLQWVSNTESDVFRMGTTGTVYYLVAGRWFSAPGFNGPWTFATPTLPPDFKQIPLEHERSRVLAAVPGTEQAAEAVMLAQVPQTARVSKSQTQPEQVTYQGTPQFQNIEGTKVQRAVNTDKDIILVGTTYFYCYQGIWFSSTSPNGPWQVATTVPSEIYTIPASSPSHHVTYVTVEDDDDDDDWVVYAAAAGYTGLMIGWGCAVWGSGWYYPPYVYYGGFYPAYYPYFPTYGYSAWYNPWTGTYGRGAVAYGPYGGAGVGARYNPRTGTYARGAVAWGPYGARGAATAYNPRTGAYGATRQGSNVYGSWGSSYVQRGDDWVQSRRVTNNRTGTTTRVTRTDDGGAITRNTPGPGGGFVAGERGGDVYAGRDGNVYRREGGSWQKYENGSWGNVDRPEPTGERASTAGERAGTTQRATPSTRSVDQSTYGQLERDRSARSSGSQRTSDYGSVRSSPSTRSTGSYRGGGGGMRGGGGRRR
jgi:hypothetical protein